MRLLHWTLRVLGILFAVFVSIFAPDVFGAGCKLTREEPYTVGEVQGMMLAAGNRSLPS